MGSKYYRKASPMLHLPPWHPRLRAWPMLDSDCLIHSREGLLRSPGSAALKLR
jgi:hypothetical protein